jgi:uncharacterized protein YjbI with pentapeptide repeats
VRRNFVVIVIGVILCVFAFTAIPGSAGASPPPRKPSKPHALTVLPVDTAAVATWSAPTSDGGSVITGYVVTASPGHETCTTSGATTCTVSGLSNAKKYRVEVRAVNAVGDGDPSRSRKVVPTTAQNCTYIGAYGDLQNCNISGEALSGINLSYADLDGTNLYGDSLDGANLTGVNGQNGDFYHVDFTGANLTDANLTDADLNGATLSAYNQNNILIAADINGAILTNSNATGGGNDLDVVEWGGITGTPTDLPPGWVFTEGYLLGPGIAPSGPYGANLSGGELAGVDLTDANLTSADLNGADLTNANLTMTDLYGATFVGTTLTGITWSDTTCPDNTNSDTYSPQTCLNDGA